MKTHIRLHEFGSGEPLLLPILNMSFMVVEHNTLNLLSEKRTYAVNQHYTSWCLQETIDEIEKLLAERKVDSSMPSETPNPGCGKLLG